MNGPLLILLVEDDMEDVMIFRSALNDINNECKVIHINDGEKFIEFINGCTLLPDLILMDINMPRVTGLACLKYLMSDKKYAAVNICMLSTSTNDRDVHEAYNNGALLYIKKPHSYKEFVAIMSWITNVERIKDRRRTPKDFLIIESRQLSGGYPLP